VGVGRMRTGAQSGLTAWTLYQSPAAAQSCMSRLKRTQQEGRMPGDQVGKWILGLFSPDANSRRVLLNGGC